MSVHQLDEETIFNVARRIEPPGVRADYLEQVCGDNRALRARVEALLAVHEQEQDFLASPPSDLAATMDQQSIAEGPGTIIGHYKLLQQIGEGGFGVVYMAEQQEPVRRKVALKIIKPGMDTKEVIARFEAERQALALMDHPNIARVLDAGSTESGRPYFVMELVKGIPITDYCDQANLAPEERLELFVSVCHAVHHAHQKGVIHRDIKPSNVLITLHDGKPVVKVIDFGVAKAINQRLTERTLFTKFAQLVGTPMYMSPEQAEMSGLDVDTRTDIYSLGVVLYELLTGATPFDKDRLYQAGYDEIRRIIRDEEPRKPSIKISTLGKTATGICAHRRTEPRRLSALLRGDLDWIVMKAMEKDRARRYETAKDLAADVLRYLDHQPVEASPPSTLYRARKFARRNRAALGVTTVIAVLLISLGGGIGTAQFARLDARRKEAEIRATRAELEITNRDRAAAEEREKVAKQKQEEADRKARDLEWLQNTALPQLQKLKDEKNWSAAFALAEDARAKFPNDATVLQYWQEASSAWSVVTDPPGAAVYRRPYGIADAPWTKIGVTPLDRIPLARGMFLYKIDKEGCEPARGLAGPDSVEIRRTLDPKGSHPGMVRVDSISPSGQKTAFWVDGHEVTNREFKEFVDAGGYREWKYWQHPFIKGGVEVPLEDVWKEFVDSTGKPGPSTWTGGTYPEGQGDFPVRGVSWYEAAAYAEFRAKSLPTIYDWERAASLDQFAYIVPASNFSGQGPMAVGASSGMGFYGVRDMAGNVTEWCFNRTTDGNRTVRGGSWDEAGYMFQLVERYDPFVRRPTFGFRCVSYETSPEPENLADLPAAGSAEIVLPPPMSFSELQQLMTVFRYDKDAPLNAQVISIDEESPSCQHETIEIDAAYGGEKLILHLFLPKNRAGRLQTLVNFPGIGAIPLKRFSDGARIPDGKIVTMLAEKGRAVCWPVYKGTFERNDGYRQGMTSIQNLEFVKQMVKDLCRAVDYLETRPEIDMDRLAYLGFSWGGNIAPMMTVVEPRFKASILVAGAFHPGSHPEINAGNYAPFVTVPVLMLNGRTDKVARQDAMFKLLGSSDKSRELYDSGHIMPLDKATERIDEWLNARFGEVGGTPPSPGMRAEELIRIGETRASRKQHADAERYFRDALEIRKRELGPAHIDTLKVSSLLGTALAQQNRDEEALQVLEETFARQQAQLGKDHHDVRLTGKSLGDVCFRISVTLSLRSNASGSERDRAVELAQRNLEVYPTPALQWWLLCFAQYRRGDYPEARQSLDKSFASDVPWVPYQFLIAAMLSWQQGDQDAARDWFAAASEWIAKQSAPGRPILQLRAEAAALIGLTQDWPLADWTRSQRIDVYTRLIQRQPNVAHLYHCRGSHYGALGKWEEAVADYAKAAELNPEGSRHWEAHAAACLGRDDLPAYDAVCREAFARFQSNKSSSVRMDWALLGALGPSRPVDPHELHRVAEAALKDRSTQNSPGFLALVPGMTLYRCGRLEEALETLPNSGFSNPKDEILAIVFRAMTHAQLGDAYTSRKLLQTAHQEIEKQLTPLDGPELPYQDRPVVWCMVQAAMREAQALIGPVQKEPAATTPDAENKPQEQPPVVAPPPSPDRVPADQ